MCLYKTLLLELEGWWIRPCFQRPWLSFAVCEYFWWAHATTKQNTSYSKERSLGNNPVFNIRQFAFYLVLTKSYLMHASVIYTHNSCLMSLTFEMVSYFRITTKLLHIYHGNMMYFNTRHSDVMKSFYSSILCGKLRYSMKVQKKWKFDINLQNLLNLENMVCMCN